MYSAVKIVPTKVYFISIAEARSTIKVLSGLVSSDGCEEDSVPYFSSVSHCFAGNLTFLDL